MLLSVEHILRRRATARGVVWPEAPVLRCVLVRAVKVALVVGTCLTLINQGDVMLRSTPASAIWWKVLLTYLVPLCVSTYSALAAMQPRR